MQPLQQQIALRLGVFFDGTGNKRDNGEGKDVTNIVRLYDLYRDQALEYLARDAREASLKVYLEGIGAGAQDSLYGQSTGRGSMGVLARVEQSSGLVQEQLDRFRSRNPDVKIRHVIFDIFGFSRGAAAARHFANDLLKGANSLLAKSLSAGSASLVDGFEWRPQEDFSLGFIGLFDTVAGIISPLQGDFSAGNANNPGLDLHIVPGTVGKVVQLVARDEFRHNFPLTRTDDDIVLPGAHSDIGGGYLLHDREKLLLSRPDSNLVSVSEANERTLAYSRTRSEFDRHLSQWQAKGLSPELVTWAVNQPYHRKRDLIAEKRVYVSIRGEREVFGHLSLIYLRIMRELAVRHQVPFDAIDARDPRFELAPELHSIAAKLHGHALGEASNTQLSEAEEALLQRHYIHQSAHWNAVNDWNNSDLDAMFINRPAEGGQRRVFANR